MSPWARWPLQAVLYAAFAGAVGYLSSAPAWELRGAQEAVLKLSVVHAGRNLESCRERSPEELARLAPNMRAPLDCPRERSPLEIELTLDGRVLYHDVVPPTGLARDGMSSVYRRFRVPSGSHVLRARLKDHRALGQYNFEREATVRLAPGEVQVVDFAARHGGFVFR